MKSKTRSKVLDIIILLAGVILGQLSLLPFIIHLIRTPRVEADVVPVCYEFKQGTYSFDIKNLPNSEHVGGSILHIHLMPEKQVNIKYQEDNDDTTPVMGFFDPETNSIYCVYDPIILIHEIRHVTEGAFHR